MVGIIIYGVFHIAVGVFVFSGVSAWVWENALNDWLGFIFFPTNAARGTVGKKAGYVPCMTPSMDGSEKWLIFHFFCMLLFWEVRLACNLFLMAIMLWPFLNRTREARRQLRLGNDIDYASRVLLPVTGDSVDVLRQKLREANRARRRLVQRLRLEHSEMVDEMAGRRAEGDPQEGDAEMAVAFEN